MTNGIARLIGSRERICRMVMGFSDPRFLPVDMIAVPHNCSDYQVASLHLPESLGDVYASVQWYILSCDDSSFERY